MNIHRNEKNRGGLKRLRLDWGRSVSEGSDVGPRRWKWLTRKVQQIYGIPRDQAAWLLNQWRRWQPAGKDPGNRYSLHAASRPLHRVRIIRRKSMNFRPERLA
jgi:hypothetical protein